MRIEANSEIVGISLITVEETKKLYQIEPTESHRSHREALSLFQS